MKQNSPLRNVIAIVFGRAGELILTFFAITLLIRYLGTSQYGIFTSAVATVTIFSKLLDLGFSQIVFREYSSSNDNSVYLHSAISFRVVLLVLFVIFFNLYAYLSELNSEEVIIINILFSNVIFASRFRNIRDLLEIPYKAKLRMDLVMFCTFLDNFLLLLLVVLGNYLNVTLIQLTVFYTIANLPGFFLLLYTLRKKNEYRYKFSLSNLKWLIFESLPLWGTGLLLALFLQLDVVIIKSLVSNEAAGLFSAAIRVGIPLAVVPLSIVTTIFPVLVKKREKDRKETQAIIDFSFKILVLLLAYLSIIVSFKSSEILSLLYGEEFIVAADTLIFVIWSFTFYYINQLSQNLTTVIGKQKQSLYYSAILMFFYLAIIFLSIDKYGILGAGFARLASSVVGFIYFYVFFSKSEFTTNIISYKSMLLFLLLIGGGYFLDALDFFIYIGVFTVYIVFLIVILSYFNTTDKLLLFKFLKEPKYLKNLLRI